MKKLFSKVLSFTLTIALLVCGLVLPSSANSSIDNLTATYGQKLSDVKLPTGYEWQNPESSVGNTGKNTFYVTYNDGVKTSDLSVELNVLPAYISSVDVKTDGSLYYTGKPIEPTVVASFKNEALTLGKDYTVTYEDNTEIGTAKIIIQGIGNFKGRTSVTFSILKIDVEEVAISDSYIELKPGESAQLFANVLPSNATYKGISWTSTDEDVATVDENGLVLAKEDGETEIIVESLDGHITSICTVCVITHPEEIMITDGTVKLRYKDSFQLKTIVNPFETTDKTVYWASSNEKVATVDENGVVTSLKKGKTVITATTADGNLIDSCEVEVYYTFGQYLLYLLLGCIWYFN